MWIEGFERVPIKSAAGEVFNGGSYVDGNPPWRGILHTTEGKGTIEGVVGVYSRTGDYPQFTADPWNKRKAQHIDTDRSATAAKNASGGVETNRLHAIQIEIMGMAAETQDWPKEILEWIGVEIVVPISKAFGIQLVAPDFVGQEAGTIATVSAPQRMSFADWTNFNGWCGHQHVPENDHWDPGHLDIKTIFDAARNVLYPAVEIVTPPLVKENEEMEYAVAFPNDPDFLGFTFGCYANGNVRHLSGPDLADNPVRIVHVDVSDHAAGLVMLERYKKAHEAIYGPIV